MITVSFRLFCCSMGQARPRWPALARASVGHPSSKLQWVIHSCTAPQARLVRRRSRDRSGGLQTTGGWRDPAIQIIGIDG
jgi:hypothetical protein